MAGADFLVIAGSAAAAASILVLRVAWSRSRRSIAINLSAWTLMLAGAVLAGLGYGAWGVSVAGLAATAAAFMLLAIAAIRSPKGRAEAPRRRAHVLSARGEPMHLLRRFATFLLTVPGAAIVSVLIAMVARQASEGSGEGNANMIAVYAMPLVWAVLMSAMLMQERQRARIVTLIVPALASMALLWAGGGA
ncbi:hypothetical protein [Stakelama pacifica]|uniref:Uncharacterized protein n=1 Tax=Stakelama pacifica TaxID=517720 RepID=A0A4R6FG26_9SPHN|nr:hypothetical protein [Stakelama pacifica]TDN80281.1 hypothetical protein EV664_11074 [Stakelama pacifica]GGO97856.1 hypothetical protein GCM10011329_27680 [Stakelama pacifica]